MSSLASGVSRCRQLQNVCITVIRLAGDEFQYVPTFFGNASLLRFGCFEVSGVVDCLHRSRRKATDVSDDTSDDTSDDIGTHHFGTEELLHNLHGTTYHYQKLQVFHFKALPNIS